MLLEAIVPSVKSYPESTHTKWARMGYCLFPLLIFNFSFLISACGLDVEDPTPPSPPVWVHKSLPEEWPERGIDAHESGGIYLEWEEAPEENIVAYLIYRAEHFDEIDSLGECELLSRMEVLPSTELEYTDTQAMLRIKYFYTLRAEDISGNRSTYSNSLGYSLLPRINPNGITPNGLSDTLCNERLLRWDYYFSIEMEDYCLTILEQNNDFIVRVVFSPQSYIDGSEYWQIPDSIILKQSQLYKWRVDTGAKYFEGLETAGSESPWATFVYAGF